MRINIKIYTVLTTLLALSLLVIGCVDPAIQREPSKQTNISNKVESYSNIEPLTKIASDIMGKDITYLGCTTENIYILISDSKYYDINDFRKIPIINNTANLTTDYQFGRTNFIIHFSDIHLTSDGFANFNFTCNIK